MSVEYSAIAAKLKAMYSKFLTRDDYEQLLERKSVNDICSYLKSTPGYGEVLEQVNERDIHRGQMEILLERTDDEHMLAFIVKTKEGTIYHAGDLNDWYWDGEPKADNQRLTSAYHVEIRKIKGMHFDAAFVPLDPRQGDHYADGILYFLKNVDCNVIFPMHYWNDANVIKRFITEYPQYKSRIKNTECTKGEEL